MPELPSTSRGRTSRERILNEATQLVEEKGVRGTSLDDIREAAKASKSQLYHYFANKEDLVMAVIERQTDNVLDSQQPILSHLDSWENLKRWCEALVVYQESRHLVGGCPLGSLANELADQDEAARVALVYSFDQWEEYLRSGFSRMQEKGELRPEITPAELAMTVMTGLEGGMLLTKTRKSTRPLQLVLKAVFTYVRTFATDPQTAGSQMAEY